MYDSLKLELQVLASCSMGVMGLNLGSLQKQEVFLTVEPCPLVLVYSFE